MRILRDVSKDFHYNVVCNSKNLKIFCISIEKENI